ncbi:alpha/beta hydrolase [Roseomonas sp. CCTCC AB2023176]|uniref:alpha/beta hydrolase n=1 Tax=Roseomonas sp. CCTCC AB2023176 TaxID=3342640 RepID=UPI0035D7EC18
MRIIRSASWLLWRIVLGIGAFAIALVAFRAWDSERGPPLQPWHLVVPEELRAEALDAADWPDYLAAEEATFAAVRARVTEALEPEARIPANRYFRESPLFPGRFPRDWNRSFALEPEGADPLGAVVLLHGLTDAPYSMRHIAEHYRRRGWVALGLRLPAHGTVPAALTDVTWEDWLAAARLALREARRRVGPGRPIHLVGYSNGGALAMKGALDALEDPRLTRVDRLVLISPMIGVTAFARFAGLAALPASLPRFARSAWLDIVPEFNPFKYNSFPVNGARQSYRLTTALQQQMQRLAAEGRLALLPPVLTFQSVVDFTVSTRSVAEALYGSLTGMGHELVLFDVNRSAAIGPLVTPAAAGALDRLLPPSPRPWRSVVIGEAGPGDGVVVERVTEAGGREERVTPIGLRWPREVYSLSHVALPFPAGDALYGFDPDPAEDFGVRLGTIALRGERGVLAVSPAVLARLTFNPFFPYLLARIGEGIVPAR